MHSYLTEGLEGVQHHEYRDIRSFKGAVDARADLWHSGEADERLPPYLIFSPVTPHQLATIDHFRESCYKRLRFLYLEEPQVLIVKQMLGPIHEMAAKEFMDVMKLKIWEAGQTSEICNMGSTTYQGKLCSKEADGSLRPLRARPDLHDWPTIILECGVSETPRRLTVDARWWIENSGGAVKVVFLLFVSVKRKTIRIEVWNKSTVEKQQHTGENDEEITTGPTPKNTILITENSVTGAPLKLKFKEIFLRKPKKKRGEANYMITEHDLRVYYNRIWLPVPGSSQDEDCKSALVTSGVNCSQN